MLRERTAAFWAARVDKDFTKQWELLEPRGRARMTPAEYAPGPVVKYLGYEVDDATVKGYFATVKVKVIAEAVLPTVPQQKAPPSVVVVEDLWVRIKGTWYRALDPNTTEGR